jgi:CDP-2,3-bis-(O-geranylgeranyl)-sn-glycerol synthase
MNLNDYTLLQTFWIVMWIMMPAYLANTIAVLTGGKYPIDQGNNYSDGNRILGDGKTWSGLIGGTIGGIIIGYLQLNYGNSLIEILANIKDVDFWGEKPIIIFFLLSFGALFGDMTASFYKRRKNLDRGEKYSLLDMYDFIAMSLLLTLIFGESWLETWILDGYKPLFTLLIATPILHRGVNIIGFKLGIKNEPW